ncbi:hypothetical protein, partial [Mycolicibacterium elephantis]|uniref:hypothetical protein n=1 Tax=Mycolicibacterium elephantis TaxID=81858 RepID=UPI0013E2E3FC
MADDNSGRVGVDRPGTVRRSDGPGHDARTGASSSSVREAPTREAGEAKLDRDTGIVTNPDGSSHDMRTGASTDPVHKPSTEIGGAKLDRDTGIVTNPDGSS